MRRRPPLVCIVGNDGSGKSTLAKIARELLEARTGEATVVWAGYKMVMSRPGVRLVQWVSSLREQDARAEYGRYHRGLQRLSRRRILFWPYLALLLAEYVVQLQWKVRRPLLLGRSVVTDRYIFDTVVGIAGNYQLGIRVEKALLRLLGFMVPRPDLVFFVEVPDEVALERKPDIPARGYLLARREYYHALQDWYDVLSLDGTEAIASLRERIELAVDQHLGLEKAPRVTGEGS